MVLDSSYVDNKVTKQMGVVVDDVSLALETGLDELLAEHVGARPGPSRLEAWRDAAVFDLPM
jgi:hypothetical protein